MQPMRSVLAPALVVCIPALASAQVPAGGEFQVNTYTTGEQLAGSVSMDPAGNFVVAWTGLQGTSNIFGQRFDAAGVRLGGEFRVNTYTGPFPVFGTDVGSAANGTFVVTWLFDGPTSTDTVRWRRFSAAGSPLGQEFVGTLLRSRSPAVAVHPAGSFVVSWHELGFYYSSFDVRSQLFDA